MRARSVNFYIHKGIKERHCLLNIEKDHPQEHKLWLFENRLVPLDETFQIQRESLLLLRMFSNQYFKLGKYELKILSAPPKWIDLPEHTEILPAYHLIKIKTSDFEVIKKHGTSQE